MGYVKGQNLYVIDQFNGLWDRGGGQDDVPPGYAWSCSNVWWGGFSSGGPGNRARGISTRPGCTAHVTLNAAITMPVLRMHSYDKVAGVRWLILDSTGALFDTGAAAPGTPILNLGWTDFSVVTLFDRAYITPHDRITGKAAESVYVYDGTTARLAAGTKPTTGLTAATSATAGNVSLGTHLYAFAFETASGFVTKPSVTTAYTAPGAKSIDFASIDTGPAGTVARWILGSQAIPNYDGNPDSVELFFVFRIADNVTTSVTLDIFDSSLVNSADYLFDQLETIPAGVALCEHEGRLVVMGENAFPSVARVSKSGQVESFSSTSGFITASAGDGAGLKNGRSYKGNLFLFKSNRTYVSYDNGGAVNTWPVQLIDSGLGAECFSIATVGESKGFTRGYMIVGNVSGVWTFNGTYSSQALTYIVAAQYSLLFNNGTMLVVDPIGAKIYISRTASGFESSYLLMGDFLDGFDQIKWATFSFSNTGGGISLVSIAGLVIASTNKFMLVFADLTVKKLYRFEESNTYFDDATIGIASVYTTEAIVPRDGSGDSLRLAVVRVRARRLFGVASMALAMGVRTERGGLTIPSQDQLLGTGVFATELDFQPDYTGVAFEVDAPSLQFSNTVSIAAPAGDNWIITRVSVYMKYIAQSRPH
jgi:hypothetical protein